MREPKICVGVMWHRSLEFNLQGHFCANGAEKVSGGQQVEYSNGKVKWEGEEYNELIFTPNEDAHYFELKHVTIGVNFHWQRQENQRFIGALKIVADAENETCVAINVVPVEEYLKSVISSEMSATASASLLKAHAVISRSWLLRQLADKGKHQSAQATEWKTTEADGEMTDELVRWYDREDHTLFDVCADDHCQRYQGVTRQNTPSVADAVEQTRGLVLTYDGSICDARFSKCCGGHSETFENCWEPASHPYLESVADTAEDGHIFCETTDNTILEQVLNGYDREKLDFFRWEVRYSANELSELVSRKSGIDFGKIEELRPLQRGESGRIVRLLIAGTRRSVIVGKELEIRRWLSESHLRSSDFDVERTDTGDYILRGRGWGHGVGLCQIGAAVMGAKGYDYQQILEHYFPKASLEKIYE